MLNALLLMFGLGGNYGSVSFVPDNGRAVVVPQYDDPLRQCIGLADALASGGIVSARCSDMRLIIEEGRGSVLFWGRAEDGPLR